MSGSSNALPSTVRRPLVIATLGVGGFLILFVIWAVTAPLATTISLHGTIGSSEPTLALQHPYGGLVDEVLVEHHATVEAGQLLVRLDTSLEQATHATRLSERRRIQDENAAIDELLARREGTQPRVDRPKMASPFGLRKQQLELKARTQRETAAILGRQIDTLNTKVALTEAQLALMVARYARHTELRQKGLLAQNENERLQEQILIVKGEIETDKASILELENKAAQTLKQIDEEALALDYELAATRQRNLTRLDELERAILDAGERIRRSEVRAPISGVVSSIPIEAKGMFAARGDTLLTLSRPLKNARLSFGIPVDYIDQVRPGMQARFVISSLPQRKMPRIDVQITAISPRAKSDDQGNPVEFEGLAVAADHSLEDFEKNFGIGALSEDMPIVLMVAVRETTFANYLVAPLVDSFSQALQD